MTHPRSQNPAEDALLRERYGLASRWSRPLVIALASVVAVASLAWLLWAAAADSSRTVSAQVQRFEVTSPHQVSVTLTVVRPQGDPVRCEIYAQASDLSVVGERTFGVPAGEARRLTLVENITTEREAVNALLRSCEVAGSASDGDG